MQTILDLYRSAGFAGKRVGSKHGGEYAGPCPFCASGKDRFRLWPGDARGGGGGSYWCRVCEAHGDAIQFLRDRQGLGFDEAKARLGLPAGALPMLQGQPIKAPVWEPKERPLPSGVWQRKAKAFVEACERELWNNRPAVLDWLETTRGVRRETAKAFRLGWNAKDAYRQRESWGMATRYNDLGNPMKLWLPEGLVIPFFQGADLVRVKVRRPAPEKGPAWAAEHRYWQLATEEDRGQGTWLIARDEPRAVMAVETEVDGLLVAQEAGDVVGVVPLGSAAMRPDAAVTPQLRRADVILDALDYDRAGAEHGRFWERNFARSYRRHPVPAGKDIGDAFAAGYSIRAWVVAGLPRSMWPAEYLDGAADVGAPDGESTAAPALNAPAEIPAIFDRALNESLESLNAAPVPARPFKLSEILADQPASVRRMCELVRACGDQLALVSSTSGRHAMVCGVGDRACAKEPACSHRRELLDLFWKDEPCAAFVWRMARLGRVPGPVRALSRLLGECVGGAWIDAALLPQGCEACAKDDDCPLQARIVDLVWGLGMEERRWIEARGGLTAKR